MDTGVYMFGGIPPPQPNNLVSLSYLPITLLYIIPYVTLYTFKYKGFR